MSRLIIWLRAFNAFISMAVTTWSVGYIAANLVFNVILFGAGSFFGFPIVVPLAIICGVVGLIALGVGLWSAHARYRHLTTQAHNILNRHDLELTPTFPDEDLHKTFEHFPNKVLLYQNGKKATAFFKSEGCLINTDFRLTAQEVTFLEKENLPSNNKPLTRNEGNNKLINQILQRALYTEGHKYGDSKLAGKQRRVLIWEKINVFFCDAPTILALSAAVIFLVTHLFLSTVLPIAPLIALVVSVGYGILSVAVKDRQCETRLRALNACEENYNSLSQSISGFCQRAEKRIRRLNILENLSLSSEINNQQLGQQASELIKTVTTFRTKDLATMQGKLAQISAVAHWGLTPRDKWFRLPLAFIYGAVTMGSCLYIALPIVTTLLGLAVVSIPATWTIIGAVSILYGICHLYNKRTAIKQEKWKELDHKEIKEIRKNLVTVQQEENNQNAQIQTIHAALMPSQKRHSGQSQPPAWLETLSFVSLWKKEPEHPAPQTTAPFDRQLLNLPTTVSARSDDNDEENLELGNIAGKRSASLTSSS